MTINKKFYKECVAEFPTVYVYDEVEDKNYEVVSYPNMEKIDMNNVYDSLVAKGEVFFEHLPTGDRLTEFRKIGIKIKFNPIEYSTDEIHLGVENDSSFFNGPHILMKALDRMDIPFEILPIEKKENPFPYGSTIYYWGERKVDSGILYGKFMSVGLEYLMLLILRSVVQDPEDNDTITIPASEAFHSIEEAIQRISLEDSTVLRSKQSTLKDKVLKKEKR